MPTAQTLANCSLGLVLLEFGRFVRAIPNNSKRLLYILIRLKGSSAEVCGSVKKLLFPSALQIYELFLNYNKTALKNQSGFSRKVFQRHTVKMQT